MIIHFLNDDSFVEIHHLERIWIKKRFLRKSYRLCFKDVNYNYCRIYTSSNKEYLEKAKEAIIYAYMHGAYSMDFPNGKPILLE